MNVTFGNYRSQVSSGEEDYNVEYNPYTNTITTWDGETLPNDFRDTFLQSVKDQKPATYAQIIEKSRPKPVCSFSEAIAKLANQPASDIVARLKALSKEQDKLYAELNKIIPLEQDYVWGEDRNGNVRPWRTESVTNYSED